MFAVLFWMQIRVVRTVVSLGIMESVWGALRGKMLANGCCRIEYCF